MGVHPHAPMKGVQSTVAVSLPLCVSVFREAYDRTKPTEEGRDSALRLRGRLVQRTGRAWTRRSSTTRLRPAPPGAQRRAYVRSC